MIKIYGHNSSEQLSKHFNVREFRCKCGKEHEILLNTDLVDKLEKLYAELNCSKIIVTSGYRCTAHDKAVGGSGTGQHTLGKAADICCYGQDGQPISSKTVCCKAQDIGFGGIANITPAYIYTHVDVRSGKKWYGDEAVAGGTSGSVTDDFNRYYAVNSNYIAELQTILNAKGAALAVDGIAGPKTLAECYKYTIELGDQGQLTRWVQQRLNALNFSCGQADGISGTMTMNAIHEFQRVNKLGQGYLGGTDWDLLVK